LTLLAGAALVRPQEGTAPASDKDKEPVQPTNEEPPAVEPSPVAAPPTATQAGEGAVASPTAKAARPKGRPAAAPRDTDAPPAGTVRVRSDFQDEFEKGHYQWRGSVDLRTAESRIEADVIDVYEVDKPDGTKGKRLVASGNVVFIQGDERLAGDRATLELDTGDGVFENARGFVQTGLLVEGRVIERLDAGKYRVEGGRFTACTQPDPRWNFTASTAMIHADDKIVAQNVLFRVRDVPALYFPYFVYPIKADQRATGFLFPRFGNSSLRGFTVGAGFFWAMGRSLDQTFYADSYSKSGTGLGHELRWALDSPSRGDFRTYVYSPSQLTQETWDWDLNWNAQQVFPGKSRATLLVRRYSNTSFQNQVQDNFNLATSRYQTEQVSYQTSLPFAMVSFLADDRRVFFSDQTRIQRHLPSLLVKHQTKRIAKSPVVFGLELRGDGLGLGNEEQLNAYSRFDMYPQISVPLTTTFLQITPKAAYRLTRYGHTADPTSGTNPLPPTGPFLTRRYFEGGVELVGPTFSHVFNNAGGFYSDKFKHVIGPEVTWTYRTPVDDFNLIPKFDGVDQQLGTNQVYYGLVQRLLAKRPGPSGRSTPFEFFNWRLGQTYYVKINEGQNEFDPNYSTSSFGPGGLPDHNSPISSRMRLQPLPGISGSFDTEYDVNFKQIRNLSVGGQVGGERASLVGSWNTAYSVSENPAERTRIRNFVRGALTLQVLRQLSLDGGVNYDYVQRQMLQSSARLRWGVQCCGFSAEMIQYHLNARDERIFRFSVDLANVGSMGNFMQDDNAPGAGRGGPAALR
jgi:LPS-assembly protein